MKHKNSLNALFAIILIFLSACSSGNEPGSDYAKYPAGPDFRSEDSGAKNALNDFSKRFMDASSQVWTRGGTDNKISSPLGASIELAMLANGASAEARGEILGALGISESDLPSFNATMRKICRDLPHDVKGSTISMANGLWLKSKWTATTQYLGVLNETFFADMNILGDSDEDNISIINKWVSDKTNGTIRELFDFPESIEMLVANIIYLDARWKKDFNELSKGNFNNLDGSCVKADMMTGNQEIRDYYQTPDGDQRFRISYSDGNISMYIFIPAETNMAAIHNFAMLSDSYYAENEMIPTFGDTHLTMPKLLIDTDTDIIPTLREMGINSLFDSESMKEIADISGNHPEISLFRQRISLKVDERGSSVAAVTYSGMQSANFPPVPVPDKIVIDRPFLFLIDAYGLPIVAGQIVKL